MEEIDVHCQTCHTLTSRKCSVCAVCSYCSAECEAKAELTTFARVACKQHLQWPREETNLGTAGAHLFMLPSTRTNLNKASSPEMRRHELAHAAKDFLHILLATSRSRVFHKTAFGMSIVLMPDSRYSCGCERMNFPMGKTSQAAAKIISNMAKLALAQLNDALASPSPSCVPDDLMGHTAPHERQAMLVSGFVTSGVVHFDQILITHADNGWTIRNVQPLWEQSLTPTDDKFYKMHYKPTGRKPTAARHSLELIEGALTPTPPPPPPPPGVGKTSGAREQWFREQQESTQVRNPDQNQWSKASPLPQVHLPMVVLSTLDPEVAVLPQWSRSTKSTTHPPFRAAAPMSNLPPTASWEDYRAEAEAQAQSQVETPPWVVQLQEALQKA